MARGVRGCGLRAAGRGAAWVRWAPPSRINRNAQFGGSLAAAGTLLAVTAMNEDDLDGEPVGAVHLHRWDGGAKSVAVGDGSGALRRSVSFPWEGRLTPWARQTYHAFGTSVAVAVRGGTGPYVGAEYVVVGAHYEDNGSAGNASAGLAVTEAGGGATVTNNGGVWVFGGVPLQPLAHLKAPVAAVSQYFGLTVSLNSGGVLAIGSRGSCTFWTCGEAGGMGLSLRVTPGIGASI